MCTCLEGMTIQYDSQNAEVSRTDHGLYVHDCEYIEKRNALIPQAERLAESIDVPFWRAMNMVVERARKHGAL